MARRARGESLEVAPCRVAAPHGAQHGVAAGLQWQVELLADLRGLGHRLDRLGPQVLGMRAGEADAPDALHGTDGPQELGEEGPAPGQVATVGVDVLPQQRDLGDPPQRQQLDLGHDVVEGAAHLGPADRGNDAEGTGVVAARLDVDPGRIGQLAHRSGPQQRVGGRLGRRCVEDLHQGPFGPGPTQQAWRAGQVVRAEHDVDPAHLLLDELPVLLGQAAADGDLEPRLGVDQLLEPAEGAVEALVSVLPDAAGVEHHDVRLLHGGGRLQAVGHQEPGQALRVVLVHLAPEGADEVGPGHLTKSR